MEGCLKGFAGGILLAVILEIIVAIFAIAIIKEEVELPDYLGPVIMIASIIASILIVYTREKKKAERKLQTIKDEAKKMLAYHKENLKEYEKEKPELLRKREELKKQLSEIEAKRSVSIVPERYHSSAKWLLEYIDDGRAYDLASSIRVWERELVEFECELAENRQRREAEERREAREKEILRNSQNAAKSAEEAKEAADLAALLTLIDTVSK